ncbi:MAG TPA: DUF1097 family protein [Jatrophihabitans sp.]|uniref:DUF1097 family protein n=1 Tax=Jatrophihabitans sp. TaxID=1932789 RepID=UPI002E0AC41C|nr:DUF1097 family protein [Jatrophihabitans sp.]
MIERAKQAVPLALVIGLLAALWVEFSLNFTFHWVTDGDLGIGLSLPSNFHLIVPAAFVSWGFFFAAGADTAAFTKVVIASVVGTVGGLLLMVVAPALADLPDFWGIAVTVAVLAFVVVVATCIGDMYYVPAVFGAFAATVFWWIATGLDGWAKNGGGIGNSVAALAKPATAGTGAFGGVLSTPVAWVFVDTLVTLLIGTLLGVASVRLTAIVTPRPAASAPARETAATA